MKQDTIATVSILRQSLESLKDDVRVLEMKVANLQREAKEMPEVTRTPQSPYGSIGGLPESACATPHHIEDIAWETGNLTKSGFPEM